MTARVDEFNPDVAVDYSDEDVRQEREERRQKQIQVSLWALDCVYALGRHDEKRRSWRHWRGFLPWYLVVYMALALILGEPDYSDLIIVFLGLVTLGICWKAWSEQQALCTRLLEQLRMEGLNVDSTE